MKPKFQKRSGLTLIELLVVIAIIAILVALWLPVLSRGRNQAAKATDLNNLHQIMLAVNLYAADNADVLTWPNWDYGKAMPNGTARAGWLYRLNLQATGPAAFNAQGGLLWDALPQPQVFLCPMDRPHEARYSESDQKVETRPQQLSSYIMNGAVIGFRTGYHSNATPVKISAMQPGDCILFEGDERVPWHFNDGSSWPSEGTPGISTRHLQGGTTGAVDGSAGCVRDADWLKDVNSTNKNRLWCYPNTADGGDPVNGHLILKN